MNAKPMYVVRYQAEQYHCREGMAVAMQDQDNGEIALFDTFWSSERHRLTKAEIETTEVLFFFAQFDELPQPRRDCCRDQWEKYAPADRRVITSQHGLETRYFIRKGATEDLPTQVENAIERLAKAEAELRSAERAVEWERQALAALQAAAEPVAVKS